MNLLKILQEQIIDYNRYAQGELKFIGFPEYPHSDCTVADKFSFMEWLEYHHQYQVIKVEGIETIDGIQELFPKFKIKNIHLFFSQRYGYSFKWHSDNVNVFLYVVKGQKTVWVQDRKYVLNPKQGVIIPKGQLHRVCSKADTWALSIGY